MKSVASVVDLVRNPQTDKIVYLVIAPDKNIEIDDKNVPVPLEDFKITPNANLLVPRGQQGRLGRRTAVNPFSSDGIELQGRQVDAYWQAHPSRWDNRRPLIKIVGTQFEQMPTSSDENQMAR